MNWRKDLTDAASSARAQPIMVALVGPPGSGKSTLAIELCTLFEPRGGTVLSLDAARARVSPWSEEADQDATPAAIGHVHARLRDALHGDRVVVVDATNAKAKNRRQLLSIARDRGAQAIAVVVLPPVEISLERNTRRSPQPGASGWVRRVPEDVVRTTHSTLRDNLPRIPAEGWDLVLRADSTHWSRGRRRPDTWTSGGPIRLLRGIRTRYRRVRPRKR